MKKLISLFCAVCAVSVVFASVCSANSYGRVIMSGLAVNGGNIIVYASEYNKSVGYNCDECAKTDWWWPKGTTHAFWLPKEGNEELYMLLMVAYIGKQDIWITTEPSVLNFGAGVPCQINVGDGNFGISMGPVMR